MDKKTYISNLIKNKNIFGVHGSVIVEALQSIRCAPLAAIKPSTEEKAAVLLRGQTVVFPMGESSLLRCMCSWLCLDSLDALAATSRHWWSLCRQQLPLMIDVLIAAELRWCSPTGLRLLLSERSGDAKRSQIQQLNGSTSRKRTSMGKHR